MRPANERWRYSVTPSLIGCAHTEWSLDLGLPTFSTRSSYTSCSQYRYIKLGYLQSLLLPQLEYRYVETAAQSQSGGFRTVSGVWDMASTAILWLAGLNIGWGIPRSQWILGARDRWGFLPFYKGNWESPTTAPYNRQMPVQGACETV